MFDEIAKWLEKHYVEIDWDAVKQCKWWIGPADWEPPPKWSLPKPFPSPLSTQLCTKLLLAQWWHGLTIRPELVNPLDDPENELLGGEGVDLPPGGVAATGSVPWKNFLRQLEGLEIRTLELKLISGEDRKNLVKLAALEEELERRRVEWNRKRVWRQRIGESEWRVKRRTEKRLRGLAQRGNMEAIVELERRELLKEGELERLLERRKAHVERIREVGKRTWKEAVAAKMAKKKKEVEGPETEEEEVVMEEVKKGIEREVEVMRVGPNPRILTCRFKELASERTCKVRVKEASKFVVGMKMPIEEPVNEAEYRGVWEYKGALPRYKGRW